MAQTRPYNNGLPSFLANRNINGSIDRVEQREKAKIERLHTSDLDANKEPLFPPPRKVNQNDGISAKLQESLGDYNNFLKIFNREKVPGQTCIGVMPVPQTPTENKTHYFPSESNKTKTKDKPSISSSNQERSNGVDKPEQKPKSSSIEKLDKKPRTVDPSRQKPLKLGEKLNSKEGKESKVANKISFEKYKSYHSAAEKPEHKSRSSTNNKTSDDTAEDHPSEDVSSVVQKALKKEEFRETCQPEISKRVEKSKPSPLQLPTRNNVSSSLPQSPQHRDMKVQSILKEMTEAVNMPLTEICTPVSKQGSRFPFPNDIERKESKEVSDPKNSSIEEDLSISDDDESDDDQDNDGGEGERCAGRTRSRSSSSSSSSSSGDSSESDDEVVADDQPTNDIQRTSKLNSPTVTVQKSSSPQQPVTSTPKRDRLQSAEKVMDISSKVESSTNSNSAAEESLSQLQTTTSKSDGASVEEKSEIQNSIKSESKIDLAKPEEKGYVDEKLTVIENDSSCLGEKKKTPSDRVKTEDKVLSSGNDLSSDTKIKVEVEKGNNESFSVESQSKTREEPKKKSGSESKCLVKLKSKGEKGKTDSKLNHKDVEDSKKLGVKLKKNVNGVVRVKKPSELKQEKNDGKKKETKRKSNDFLVKKKTKAKFKDSSQEISALSKNKANTHPSKHTDRTKKENREKLNSDRRGSLGFDSPNDDVEEDSLIDVVGDNSPVVKKKKKDTSEKTNGVNGVNESGHVKIPLGIRLVHDEEKDPTSLIVKIPLSLLKRIPGKFSGEMPVANSSADIEFNSVEDGPQKTSLSLWKKNGENGEMEVDHIEETAHDRKQHSNDNGKRSPNWDNNRHPNKRVRRDSHRPNVEDGQHSKRPSQNICDLIAEVEADIRKVEPDAHLQQAKFLKREADKLSDKEAKSRTYVEAIVRFICCGRALENKEDGEVRAVQMYSETTELLRFILKHVLSKTEDKRLLILCLRVQSLLLHTLYRMKSKQVVRNSQLLAEHFKATHKNNITSPYPTSNKHGSTPSPLSPTPSPAGSVGSTGSNSSGDGSHSQNGRHSSTASVTSPVSVSIPQRIHGAMAQYVSTTSKLVNSIEMWDKADSLASDYQDFFIFVDSISGPLTFHSSIPHIVNYVKKSLSSFHEHDKQTR